MSRSELSKNAAKNTYNIPHKEAEYTSVWSFPERGGWATHNPQYRGNFAPQIARNVIEMYSEEGDYILDSMAGGGTTLIEAKLLGRNAIGVDINPSAVAMCEEVLKFAGDKPSKQKAVAGDARDLYFLKDESIDMVLTHPPYMNIIRYSEGKIEGDLSNISSMEKFCGEMGKVAAELYRVLKADKYCAVLMGDTRRGRHYVPLAFNVMRVFMGAGFVLKEDIVKVQHNCRYTERWRWKARKDKFYLIMHEHLFVFRKPKEGEDLTRVKFSR
jgi:DNA modification methylase